MGSVLVHCKQCIERVGSQKTILRDIYLSPSRHVGAASGGLLFGGSHSENVRGGSSAPNCHAYFLIVKIVSV